MRFKALGLIALLVTSVFAFGDIPAPTKHFNDNVGIVTPAVAQALDKELTEFEKATSNQVVVIVANNFDGALEDTTQKLFHTWGIGQKDKNNGVVLFWFTDSRKIRIEVGYGLEGCLPDVTAKRIISEQITPSFKEKKWDIGITQGVHSIMAATKGEYKGTAPVVNIEDDISIWKILAVLGIVIVVVLVIGAIADSSGGGSGGGGGYYGGGYGGGSSSGGSSSSSSSSSSSGDSGGFSGGGGDSGGGGASGGY